MDSSSISSTSSEDSAAAQLASLRLQSTSKLDLQSLFEAEGANTDKYWTQQRSDFVSYPSSSSSNSLGIQNVVREGLAIDASSAKSTVEAANKINSTHNAALESSFDPFSEEPMANSTAINASPNTKKHFRISKTVRFRDWERSPPRNTPQKSSLKKKKVSFFTRSNKKQLEERPPSSDYSQTPDTSHQQVPQNCHFAEYAHSSLLLHDPFPQRMKEPTSSSTDPPSSVFSNKDNATDVSSGVENIAIDNPYDSTMRLNAEQKGKLRSHSVDPTASLVRNFNKLSLELDASKPSGSFRGFSLRLNDNSKPQVDTRDLTPEVSLDHVDILDQNPPSLPEISKSFIVDTAESMTSTRKTSMPLFDTFTEESKANRPDYNRITESLKGLLLRHSLSTGQSLENIGNFSLNELLTKVDETVSTLNSKLDFFKVNEIKSQKILRDNEWRLQECASTEAELCKKVVDLQDEVRSLQVKCNKLELKCDLQEKTTLSEIENNKDGIEQLRLLKLKVGFLEPIVQSQKAIISDIVDFMGREVEGTTEQNLLDNLKLSFKKMDELKLNNSSLNADKGSHQVTIDHLTLSLDKENQERLRLQDLLNSTTFRSLEIEKQLEAYKSEKETLLLEVLEKEKHIKVMDQKMQGLEENIGTTARILQNCEQESSLFECEKARLQEEAQSLEQVICEQMKLIEDLNLNTDQQSTQITRLKNELNLLSAEKAQMKGFSDTLSYELEAMTDKFNKKCDDFEALQHHNELIIKGRNHTIKQRDDELRALKRVIDEHEERFHTADSEIKEVRLKLSDKTSDANLQSKKIEGLTKSLEASSERCKCLLSDLLRNSHVKQELKRTLSHLSVAIIREFEGLIDDASLYAVKEGLRTEHFETTEDENLPERLNDIAQFIQEAVCLLVKEYWTLSRRFTESQKHSISNSSITALQRVNEQQATRMARMEKKLHYYETVFKKINIINERPSNSLSRRLSMKNLRQGSSEQSGSSFDGHTVHSDDSGTSGGNGLLRDKQVEINKLLSKVTKKNMEC